MRLVMSKLQQRQSIFMAKACFELSTWLPSDQRAVFLIPMLFVSFIVKTFIIIDFRFAAERFIGIKTAIGSRTLSAVNRVVKLNYHFPAVKVTSFDLVLELATMPFGLWINLP